MNSFIKLSLCILSISLVFTSCVSNKKLLYLQDIEQIIDNPTNTNYNITIKSNDLLTIQVSALNPESVLVYNQSLITKPPINGVATQNNGQQPQTYIVSKEGTIEFPEMGSIKLSGLTIDEATEKMKELVSKYVKNPIVNIRIVNFKVTVLGEVQRAGTFPINDQRVTILEALGLSGDMTIFGNRNEVKVIREVDGLKTYGELDITSASIINSPFYYLQQNDVVIVSPNRAQIQSSSFNRNTGVYISLAGIIISVLTILTRN
ncbi:polysaccharide biosynthesis/export family protein [Dokdonia ponticola]|uniref:Polysaccharide biosynthesis/export family protein n=1 Tax=Dokdonia ponticola TaxID=2041041 RepID=A0ABV9HTN0_9FLAO